MEGGRSNDTKGTKFHGQNMKSAISHISKGWAGVMLPEPEDLCLTRVADLEPVEACLSLSEPLGHGYKCTRR
jgi:hypothetical protein